MRLVRAACVSGWVSGFFLGLACLGGSVGLNWVSTLDSYLGCLACSLPVSLLFFLVIPGYDLQKN